MTTRPRESTDTSWGLPKLASRAGPLSPPKARAPLPATVRIVPVRGSMARMRWFQGSAK